MAISCSFFDHVKYPASEFLNRDKDFINNGVLHPATDFALSSPSTPNMTMNAAAGVAWVNGYRISYDANPVQVLTFTTADLTNSRIDLVEIGYTGAGSTGTGVIKVVTGTPAASPLQPQPDTGFMALFAVAVAPNATALTTANVTDLRVSVSLTGATNTPLASSVPASITPNSTGNTGTGTHAAREDHQHPAPATYPPSAHASTHGSAGSDPLPSGAATDSVIGNRIGDPTLISPASTGTITQLFGWIMGRIKAITGKTNWYDAPDITLAILNTHKSRHAIGGSDVIAPADIGAATSAQGTKADGSIQSSLGTALDQVLVSSGVGVWAAKTLAQFKTWLGLGSAAYTDSTAYATSAQGAESDSTATTVTAHLADYVKQVPYAVDSGTANTYAVALNPAPTVYVDGMAVAVKITNASTGASTLNINALGVKPILDSLGNAITSGGLKAGLIYSFRYNATTGNFIVQGKGGGGNAVAGDLLSGKTATVDTGQITGTLALTGSAVAGDILTGKTAYNTDPKTQIAGTIPSVVSQFLARAGTTDKALSNAYYQGCSIPAEPDALAVNILTGKTILGVAGTAKRTASGSGTSTNALTFTPALVVVLSDNGIAVYSSGLYGAGANAISCYYQGYYNNGGLTNGGWTITSTGFTFAGSIYSTNFKWFASE